MYSFRGFCGGPPAVFCAWKLSPSTKKHGGGIPTKPTKSTARIVQPLHRYSD